MKRREFIALIGGAAAPILWPLAARAQQAGRVPVIGLLGSSTAATQNAWVAEFTRRLRELGWFEGSNVAIEYRWAEGRLNRSPELIAELIRLKADVLVTHATPNILAAKQATSTIPVVFALAGDPVGNNLVASLARPGGNVTGLSMQQAETAGKRLELLREVVPGGRRVAFITNSESPNNAL